MPGEDGLAGRAGGPIGPFYPVLLVALLAAAVVIAASRILLGMHFLTDVLAGTIIGTTLGRLSFHIFHAL